MATVRLTYAQLAVRLGRSTDAARMLVRRKRWQVVKGNDGRSVVLVDEAELPNERSPERAPEQTEQRPDAALLERAVRAEERAAALRELVDRERELVDQLRAELAAARRPFWRRWWG